MIRIVTIGRNAQDDGPTQVLKGVRTRSDLGPNVLGASLSIWTIVPSDMSNSHYTVGWICAISTEYVAARVFLNKVHDQVESVSPHDIHTGQSRKTYEPFRATVPSKLSKT